MEKVVKSVFEFQAGYLLDMQREFNLYHAWLHLKCMGRMFREYVLERKHRGSLGWHIAFYGNGILRSLGLKS